MEITGINRMDTSGIRLLGCTGCLFQGMGSKFPRGMFAWYILTIAATVMADPFTPVPDGGLTLHISVVPSEIDRIHSLPRRVVWPYAQCVTTVTVVVDPPHGGKTYGSSRQSDPVYLPVRHFRESHASIRSRIRRAMAPSMSMFGRHCPVIPALKIGILNHTRLDRDGWFDTVFVDPAENIDTDPMFRDTRPFLPKPQRVFKNTVMYVWSIVSCRTRYLLHLDIDTLGLRNHAPVIGHSPPRSTFIRTAIELFMEAPTVFVMSTGCNVPRSVKTSDLSTRVFVVDVSRFRGMLPLVGWTDHIENVINTNMRRHSLVAVALPGRPCIASSYITRKIFRNTNW